MLPSHPSRPNRDSVGGSILRILGNWEHTKNIIGVPGDFGLWIGNNNVEAPMSRLKLLRDQRQLALSKLESLSEDHPLRPRYLERVRELDDQIEALSSFQ